MNRIEDVATCIGCGCTDLSACLTHTQPVVRTCHWLEVDYAQGVGVCSECAGHLDRFKREHLPRREAPRMGPVAALLYRFAGQLRYRLISIGGRPYLERHFLFKRFSITAYLHRFVSGDDERNVHDHPWSWAFSLILSGGYTEERLRWFDPNGCSFTFRRMFPLRINIIGPRAFHRVTKPKPDTWTLFVHGPRVKGWGFLSELPMSIEVKDKSMAVVYHQPHASVDNRDWIHTAPRASEVRKEKAHG